MPEGAANLFSTSVGLPGTDASGVQLPVADPAPPALVNSVFRILVNADQPNVELMEVTGGQSTTLWTVTRAAEPWGKTGTQIPSVHHPGESVDAVVTAQALQNLIRQAAIPFVFNQSAASGVWNVPHSLGRKPMVQVFDTQGNVVSVDVHHLDNNNLQILCDAPLVLAGTAVCV